MLECRPADIDISLTGRFISIIYDSLRPWAGIARAITPIGLSISAGPVERTLLLLLL